MGRKSTNKKEKKEKMKKLIRRIYAYVALGLICVSSFFLVKITQYYKQQDVSSLTKGSYQYTSYIIYLPKSKIFQFPTLSKISNITKEDVGYGVKLDYWNIHNYTCTMKISDDCNVDSIPKGTKIVFSGKCDVVVDSKGSKMYRIYVMQPSFIEYVECSSYIDHYIGIWGEICHVTEQVFTGISIEEFNRLMVIATKLQVAKNGENHE